MVNLTASLIDKIKEAQALVHKKTWFAIEFGWPQGVYLTTNMLTEIDRDAGGQISNVVYDQTIIGVEMEGRLISVTGTHFKFSAEPKNQHESERLETEWLSLEGIDLTQPVQNVSSYF
ncbi:hypothetical protein GAGA_0481 [Paraglaciecola agarilytica NO2]|uniref:Phage protein n=2 Tax=Paraglaciecola chathamensis TaxID=368405 RepID=A0ABQ0I1Z0_9ALTE|nr:hypothetical protein GAGA_0481 [Paraglaciecola agarilytica NO2]